MRTLSHFEARTRVEPAAARKLLGRHPGPAEYDVLLTGPTRITAPGGRPLAVYLPGELPEMAGLYDALRPLSLELTDNRGAATGSPTVVVKRRSRAAPVYSATVGHMEGNVAQAAGGGRRRTDHQHCRLTAHTARHLAEFEQLAPMLRHISDTLVEYVPQRAAVQAAHYARVPQEHRIPDTLFTTLTVNNTFATGFHTDAGDLEAGFSCLAVHRRGEYRGGVFVLGEYRVGIDLQDGDLLLMDAHHIHGNTPIERVSPDAERISVVCYFRTDMVHCDA